MAAMGALTLTPEAIGDWVAQFRAEAGAEAPLLLNLLGAPPTRRRSARRRTSRAWPASWRSMARSCRPGPAMPCRPTSARSSMPCWRRGRR
jgi:hypothetical protein